MLGHPQPKYQFSSCDLHIHVYFSTNYLHIFKAKKLKNYKIIQHIPHDRIRTVCVTCLFYASRPAFDFCVQEHNSFAFELTPTFCTGISLHNSSSQTIPWVPLSRPSNFHVCYFYVSPAVLVEYSQIPGSATKRRSRREWRSTALQPRKTRQEKASIFKLA